MQLLAIRQREEDKKEGGRMVIDGARKQRASAMTQLDLAGLGAVWTADMWSLRRAILLLTDLLWVSPQSLGVALQILLCCIFFFIILLGALWRSDHPSNDDAHLHAAC